LNSESLNIERAVRSLEIPLLVVHGDSDKAVSDAEGRELANWAPQGQFASIPDTGHTFGTSHPWTDKTLPPPAMDAVNQILIFLNDMSY
jgi:pimeloyl-ACP methyl ester carboxylesterase